MADSLQIPRHERIANCLSDVAINDLDQHAKTCWICLEPITPASQDKTTTEDHSPTRLNCGHTYGKLCISLWLEVNQTCPECRTEVITGSRELNSWRTRHAVSLPTTALDSWRARRAATLADLNAAIQDESRPDWLGALRLEDFILRETSDVSYLATCFPTPVINYLVLVLSRDVSPTMRLYFALVAFSSAYGFADLEYG